MPLGDRLLHSECRSATERLTDNFSTTPLWDRHSFPKLKIRILDSEISSHMPKVSSCVKYLPFAPVSPSSILSSLPQSPGRLTHMECLSEPRVTWFWLHSVTDKQWQEAREWEGWSKNIDFLYPASWSHCELLAAFYWRPQFLSSGPLLQLPLWVPCTSPHLAPSGLEVIMSCLPDVASSGIIWKFKSCCFPCCPPAAL